MQSARFYFFIITHVHSYCSSHLIFCLERFPLILPSWFSLTPLGITLTWFEAMLRCDFPRKGLLLCSLWPLGLLRFKLGSWHSIEESYRFKFPERVFVSQKWSDSKEPEFVERLFYSIHSNSFVFTTKITQMNWKQSMLRTEICNLSKLKSDLF